MTLTAEQLEQRKTGIGGSDAAAALGLSRWTSPYALYLDKIGESTDESSPLPLRVSSALEPLVRQLYADETGESVAVMPMMRHPEHEFMIVNADGISDSGVLVELKAYENKTTDWGDPLTDEVPDEYDLQCRHGMAIFDLHKANIGVLFGKNDFQIYIIERDMEMEEMMIDGERRFWQRVIDRDPPEPRTADDIKKRWPRSTLDAGFADSQMIDDIAELKQLKKQRGELDDKIEALELSVKKVIGDREGLLGPNGKPLVTWKSSRDSIRFDKDAFQSAHQDLYKQFEFSKPGSRRFLVK